MERIGIAVVLVVLVLLIGGGLAGSSDQFDPGEVVSTNLTVDHTTNADGYYEDGSVTYIGFREIIIDTSEYSEDISDLVDSDVVIDKSDWKVFTDEENYTTFEEDTHLEDVADRYNEENEQRFEVEREFEQSFSSSGEYTYYLTLVKIEGDLVDFEENEWEWNIEEIDYDAYLFEIDEGMLTIFGRSIL